MWTWISNTFAPSGRPSAQLVSVAEGLGDLRRLVGLRSDQGGIKRERVVDAIARACLDAGLHEQKVESVDFLDACSGVGVRVEAGRAHTNNGAVMAVLEAAQDADVRQLVLVVPDSYKSSGVYPAVNDQLTRLMSGKGIALSLDGVALLPY